MPRTSKRLAKKTGEKVTATKEPGKKTATPKKTVEQASVPVAKKQVQISPKVVGKPAEKSFVVSEEEKKLLEDLRSNNAKAKENAQKQNEEDEINELPNSDEEAYAAVFAPLSVLNKVHLHCTGVVQVPPAALRKLVKDALAQAKSWDEDEKKIVKKAVAKALPALGEKLIGAKGLPVPKTFSAGRVIQAYIEIYEKHLYLTETLAPNHGTSRKRRRRKEDSSGSSSSDSDQTHAQCMSGEFEFVS